MVISTGTICPTWLAVRSLYSLTKPMMLTACGPRPVPTGGAGVALPAGSCSLTIALTRFAIHLFQLGQRDAGAHGHAEGVDLDLGQVALDLLDHPLGALVAAAGHLYFVALGNAHSFSTCRKSSSTRVSRPKNETSTQTLPFSRLISSTTPMNSANGPSMTLTLWPRW